MMDEIRPETWRMFLLPYIRRNAGEHGAAQLTVIVEPEGYACVSLCPEVDVASQEETLTEAHNHLEGALELFFEAASTLEIDRRLYTRNATRTRRH